MDSRAYLTALRREGAAVAAAARRGLEPVVWTCPGWTVGDVVGHLGAVHRQKEQIVRLGLDHNPPRPDPPPTELVEWYEEGLGLLAATLEATDPAAPAFTWHDPDQTVGFWHRRMAHETLIHRIDAEVGHGPAGPVDPLLGLDGIDEVLTLFMAGRPDWAEGSSGLHRVRISPAGTDRRWTLRFGTWSGTSPATGTVYTNEPAVDFDDAPGDVEAELTGPPDVLDLWLWGRTGLDQVHVTGERDLARRLRKIAAEATS